ncbi:hypothetical protein NQK81_33840 [Amycolatopsis roodepoortensis]|uniref:hypothetical protein n=1 Tax=Amycolatopsis roodepoortensis TaxID=700274 RepID=UPI00214AC3FB|nr:hypothetical protein [Amycolatopsis roodepoortensis]UUV29712.1 hypothetical protein NQK81_33840 [Amycolatopsis roodepoortensis]
MLREIELDGGKIVYRGEDIDSRTGLTVRSTASEFEIGRPEPTSREIFYRLGAGRIEFSEDVEAFRARSDADLDHGRLLALVEGLPEPPDGSPLAGVYRLTVGSYLTLGVDGVSVRQRRSDVVPSRKPLHKAVTRYLGELGGDYGIAFSGGLSSTFLATCARAAGHAPVLFHAGGVPRPPLPAPAGLRIEYVPCDLAEVLDQDMITGEELVPPTPELEMRRHLVDRLTSFAQRPLVLGSLLESLVTTTLSEVEVGRGGRRLLACEPFHTTGVLPDVTAALAALETRGANAAAARAAEAQPGLAAPATGHGGHGLPGLTEDGRELLKSAQLATGALWRAYLDHLPAPVGRAQARLWENGALAVAGDRTIVPGLDAGVLASVAGYDPRRLGHIRDGLFVNQVPMREALAKDTGRVRESSSAFALRAAAARHLHRERKKVAIELSNGSVLADLGLLDIRPVLKILDDAVLTADRAPMLLRLTWLERWLRKR